MLTKVTCYTVVLTSKPNPIPVCVKGHITTSTHGSEIDLQKAERWLFQ